MSTSTSPSTETSSGECVVCGAITTKRCSSCAASGTDWMFFCSIEHQRLVSLPLPFPYSFTADENPSQIWSAHKRVCGSRSHPFQWPGFSSKEIEDILELSQKPHAPKRVEGVTCNRWLDTMFVGTEASFEKRLSGLKVSLLFCLSPSGYLYDRLNIASSARQQILERLVERSSKEECFTLNELQQIVGIRSDAQRTEVATDSFGGRPTVQEAVKNNDPILANPFNFLAGSQMSLDPKLPFFPSVSPKWSKFHHRHLNYLALLNKVSKVDPWDEELWNCTCRSRRSLVKFCEETMKRTHPDLAIAIIEHLNGFGKTEEAVDRATTTGSR